VSALDDLIDNEHSRLHGEKLRHLDGRRSRVARESAAREELVALRGLLAEASKIGTQSVNPRPQAGVAHDERTYRPRA